MNIIIYSCMVAFTLRLSSAQFILGVVVGAMDGLMEDSMSIYLGVHRRPCLLCVSTTSTTIYLCCRLLPTLLVIGNDFHFKSFEILNSDLSL